MSGLSPYKRTLTAGEPSNIQARGTTIIVRDCTGPVEVRLRQNVQGASGESYALTMRKGQKQLTASEFHTVELLSSEAQAVELLIGYGDYVEPAPNIAVSDFFRGSGLIDFSDGNVHVVCAENPLRHRITIKNRITSAAALMLVTAEMGSEDFPLEPGESFTAYCKGAISAYQEDGGTLDCDVYTLEESYSAPT